MDRVSKGKPSSLLGLIISDDVKKFYNIDTWCLSYKKSLSLTMGSIQEACRLTCTFLVRLGRYVTDKHFNLFGLFVIEEDETKWAKVPVTDKP